MADITVKTRAKIIEDYQRNYLVRCPTALTGPGTPVYRDAVLFADGVLTLYANNVKVAREIDLDQKSVEGLKTHASDKAITLSDAVGATGAVTIRASSGGTVIFEGDELIHPNSKLVYYCTTKAAYSDGDDVPVASRSTGPETNQDPGTVLQWRSPRFGCATTCTVAEQTDGSGLKGGAAADTREKIIEKIRDTNANPPAAGNGSEYLRWIRETPGIQIEAAFVYQCYDGPGTIAWTFTVAPDKYGSRIPTTTQLALVRYYVASKAPKSDIGVGVLPVNEDLVVCIGVDWETPEEQWTNETTWPDYFEDAPSSGSGAVVVSAGSSATSIVLETTNANYTTCGDPVAGQVFALWDNTNRVFVRKTALSVAGTGPWTITVDTAFGASDTAYVPVSGQRIMPWSDGLAQFVGPVISAFEGIGPGQITSPGYLDGSRTSRYPYSPKAWPDRLTKTVELEMESLGSVTSLDILEGLGVIATPAATPHILSLSDLAAYPRP